VVAVVAVFIYLFQGLPTRASPIYRLQMKKQTKSKNKRANKL